MNLVLAFQTWDLFGWAAQVLFFVRVYHQWLLSERAGRSLVPTAFWWYSVVATLLLAVYVIHRKDPVFLAGALINGSIYVRNLMLTYRSPAAKKQRTGPPWGALIAGLLIFSGLVWLSSSRVDAFGAIVDVGGAHPLWLAFGFLAQAVWSSRFVVQWIASERAGTSILPASFFSHQHCRRHGPVRVRRLPRGLGHDGGLSPEPHPVRAKPRAAQAASRSLGRGHGRSPGRRHRPSGNGTR